MGRKKNETPNIATSITIPPDLYKRVMESGRTKTVLLEQGLIAGSIIAELEQKDKAIKFLNETILKLNDEIESLNNGNRENAV